MLSCKLQRSVSASNFWRENVLKMNMTRLAEELGVTLGSVSKIEKDLQSDISAKTAHRLGELVEPLATTQSG